MLTETFQKWSIFAVIVITMFMVVKFYSKKETGQLIATIVIGSFVMFFIKGPEKTLGLLGPVINLIANFFGGA